MVCASMEDRMPDMSNYHELLLDVLFNGERREDRTGVGTYSLFGRQLSFDLERSFPLLTTKRVHWKSVVHELLWFIRGEPTIGYLKDNGVTIWDEWADSKGHVGPLYGVQWRDWYSELRKEPIDQLQNVIEDIKTDPYSRRHIVSAWNVGELEYMALPPCHMMFQFYAHNDGKLSCHMYQRSADMFLGVPFNIASYALLTKMVAKLTDRHPKNLTISFGDVHLYTNHVEQAIKLTRRQERPLPMVAVNGDVRSINDYTPDDIILIGYDPHPTIKAEVAV